MNERWLNIGEAAVAIVAVIAIAIVLSACERVAVKYVEGGRIYGYLQNDPKDKCRVYFASSGDHYVGSVMLAARVEGCQ